MQAIRIIYLLGIFVALGSCGSSTNTSRVKESQDQWEIEAWYILEVGRRPETGRSHYYRVKISDTDKCVPDSIHFEDLTMALSYLGRERVWEAYRHFGPDDSIPVGVLAADISLSCDSVFYRISVDCIYLKERVILP